MTATRLASAVLVLLTLCSTAVPHVARAETSEAEISATSPDGLGTATVHYQHLAVGDSPTAEEINDHIDAEANRAVTQAMWDGSTRRPWTFDASGRLTTWAITVSEVFTGVYNTAEPHMPMNRLGSVVCDTRSGIIISWDNLFSDKTAGLTRLGEQLETQVAAVASPTELRNWRRSGQFAPVDVNFKYWIPTREGVALQIPEVQFGRGLKVVIVPWSAISDLIAPEFLPITG